MIGETVSHYKILERIGVVYKARDTRLKRTVALRFNWQEVTATPTSRGDQPSVGKTLTHLNLTLET